MYDLVYNILTYNRVELSTRTVAQFIEQQRPHTLIDVIDDHSTDDISEMRGMIDRANAGSRAARLTVNERHLGIRVSAIGKLNDPLYDEQDFVYLSDDDVLLSSRFADELDRLLRIMRADPTIFGASLFNVDNGWHYEVAAYGPDHVCKTSFGGVSFLVRARDFHAAIDHYLTPEYRGIKGWDFSLCHFADLQGKKLISTRMSYVQHVGTVGAHSSPENHDHATNFVP